ncbi:MAG: Gfo/Idh/MocA family protein [Candidatus Promineifilaceae bacterium]
MTNQTTKVGIIGTGNISSIYLKNGAALAGIDIHAVADLNREAAAAQAEKFGVPNVYSVEELLADPEIEIVLNLTTPQAHGLVGMMALNAGKSVYNEKPLALTRADAKAMLDVSAEKGLRVGCAPDTFMGASLQTCRKLIDDGAIGTPVAATAFMMGFGMETWHPNPEFFFKPGGGPMFDMGPYYLTCLVNLLGPVSSVSGMVATGRKQRTITSQPLAGQVIDVEVPTHVSGMMQFASGAVGTIITSFDTPASRLPHIEIYGTEATLSVPDPNRFGDPITIRRAGERDWSDVALTHAYAENSRGLGLADMAHGLRTGEAHRASGALSYHVLDLMWAFHDSAESQTHVKLQSTCERPAAMSETAQFGEI